MMRYLVQRFVSALVVLLGVSVLSFMTTALIPGNPAEVLLGTEATPERLAAATHELGLDQPLWVRYGLWLQHILRGDLGISTLSQQPVASLLGTALPVTLELTLFSLLLAVAFALPVGPWIGVHSRRWWTRLLMFTIIGVLREDYVKTARSKGLSGRRVLFRHVVPNALIPALTYLGLQLGVLISGAIVTEVIFALPGMGSLGLHSILDRDYPVVQGVVLVIAAGYVVANMLIDLAYTLVDPRVRVT